MQNSYLLSSISSLSCRRRKPMSFQFDDYILNDSYVRCTLCIQSCCSCCLNSVYRRPIHPHFNNGLRQSNLIHLSASRNLTLCSLDRCCGSVCRLKGERRVRGMVSNGKGRRKSSHHTCDADVILSLLTEEEEEEDECFDSRAKNSGGVDKVEKRVNRNSGIMKSIESNQWKNNNVEQATEERSVNESSAEFKRESEKNGEELQRRQRTTMGSQSDVMVSDGRRNKSEKKLTVQEDQKSSQKHLKSTDIFYRGHVQVNNINRKEKHLTERTDLSESTKSSCEGTSKHASNHQDSLTLLSEMEDKLRTEEIMASSVIHNFERNDNSVTQDNSIGSVNRLHRSSVQFIDQVSSSQIRKEKVVEMVSVHEGEKCDGELRSSSQISRKMGAADELESDSENHNLMKKPNKNVKKKKPESVQNPSKHPIQTGEVSVDKTVVENGVDKNAPISTVSSFSSEMNSLVNGNRVSHASKESNPGLKTNEFEQERFEKWEVAYNIESEQHKIDEMFMKEAILEAKKAADMWEVPVGAVLVQQGKIIARGCNLVEELRDSTAHAEMICIREASNLLRTWRLAETTLYVTLEPCPMCAGAILQARIGTVVWGAPNKLLGADGSWIRLFPSNGEDENGLVGANDKATAPVHPFHPKMSIRRGVLAGECAEAMQKFFQLRRKKKEHKPKQEEVEAETVSHRCSSKFLTKIRGAFSL
ncbi:uncharacterized protein LOC124944642 [Impatiens glandulifera]|uniref:uncharacterized protein LOC124944642 n=1 Tax=Impatiens glandulifera TaxID=253017 RepID=UPI001FB0F65F|nr:uncharacterized protein LOC124944642 [Impatiens glandulifera]